MFNHDRIVPVVDAELHIPYEQTEASLVAAGVELETALGEGPAVLDPVDTSAVVAKVLAVIDIEAVIRPKAVRVHPRLGLYIAFDGDLQAGSADPFGEDHPDLIATFEQPEHRDLAGGTATAFTLSPTIEIRLVDRDFLADLGQGLPAFLSDGLQRRPEGD